MEDELFGIEKVELNRQKNMYNLIASENIPSAEQLRALGSVITNKYSEGYPGKRYYQGNKYIDMIEVECKKRLLKLFDAEDEYAANVQVLSGATANLAVYLAFLNPGDKILALKLDSGAHITHGLPVNFSGKMFDIINYELDENGIIDYEYLEKIAMKAQPKLIICGYTAYSRIIDFTKFSDIAKSCGAYLMADISHIAGLIAGGAHPSPVGHADFITSTTHKTLRGIRSAFVMVKKDYEKKMNSAVFPGIFGGPKNNEIMAKAICFKEAATEEFKTYTFEVIRNTRYVCEQLKLHGLKIVSDGTDNHLFVIDLSEHSLDSKTIAEQLEERGIVVNVNTIPNDKGTPWKPQGIRIGLAFETTKGIDKLGLDFIVGQIVKVIKEDKKNGKR